MKFILMMNAPRGTGDWEPMSWAPEDLQAHITFMRRLNQQLMAEGVFAACEALSPPAQARIVRAGPTGEPEVTDGPFAEAKEFLAGYWIVDVESPQEAYAIAARASAAPGPDGKLLRTPIEVREVMNAPLAGQ